MSARLALLLLLFAAPACAQTAAPPTTLEVPPVVIAPLSLEDAIQTAFQNQGDVLAAGEQTRAARERIAVAQAARSPQLSASVGSNYVNSGSVVSIPSTGTGTGGATTINSTGTTFTTGVALSQNVFDSGRTRETVRQGRAAFDIARGTLGTTRTNLAYQVAQRFYEQLRQETLVAQRAGQVEVAGASLGQIQAQITVGTSPRSDLLAAQVNVAQARFDLLTAQNALRTARIDLRNALGLDDGPALQLVGDTAEAPATLPSEAELLALARSRRPDLQSGQAQIRQSQSQLKAARIEQLPSIAATLALNLDPRKTDQRTFNVGATVAIPLFDAGSRRAQTRAARDELSAGQLRLAQLERSSDAAVRSAVVNLQGQRARVELATQLVASAGQNLEVARGRYAAGVGIALDIVNAQNQLFGAQTSLTGAQFDARIALANVDLATGRYANGASNSPSP